MLNVCGATCTDCPHLNVECKGDCETQNGRVYWTAYIGVEFCPLYRCVDVRGFKSCGDCRELPCQIWFTLKDPSWTDEEHQQSIKDRVRLLRAYK